MDLGSNVLLAKTIANALASSQSHAGSVGSISASRVGAR